MEGERSGETEAEEIQDLLAYDNFRTSDGQALLGFSSLVIGAVSIGCVFFGVLKGNEIVPMLLISSVGLFVSSFWYMRSARYEHAWIFGSFAGFNGTYALLQLGVTNGWYGIPVQDLTTVVTIYVAIWLALFALVVFATPKMPFTSRGLLLSAEIGLVILLVANVRASLSLLRWASLPTFFIALMSLLFMARVL